jgi:hypothetical protein
MIDAEPADAGGAGRADRGQVARPPVGVRGVGDQAQVGAVAAGTLGERAQARDDPVERAGPQREAGVGVRVQVVVAPAQQHEHVGGTAAQCPRHGERFGDRSVHPPPPTPRDGRSGQERDGGARPQGPLPVLGGLHPLQGVGGQVRGVGGHHAQRCVGAPQLVPGEGFAVAEHVVHEVVEGDDGAPAAEAAHVDEHLGAEVLGVARRARGGVAGEERRSAEPAGGRAVDLVEGGHEAGPVERTQHPGDVRAAHPATADHEGDLVPVVASTGGGACRSPLAQDVDDLPVTVQERDGRHHWHPNRVTGKAGSPNSQPHRALGR